MLTTIDMNYFYNQENKKIFKGNYIQYLVITYNEKESEKE